MWIIFCSRSQCIAMSVSLSSSSSTHLLFGTDRAYTTSSCWNAKYFCKSFTKLQSKCQKKIPKQNSNNIMIRNRIFHDFSQERIKEVLISNICPRDWNWKKKVSLTRKVAPWSVGEVDTETIENVWHPLLKKNRT